MDTQTILGTGGAGFIGTNPGWEIEGCRGFGVLAVDLGNNLRDFYVRVDVHFWQVECIGHLSLREI